MVAIQWLTPELFTLIRFKEDFVFLSVFNRTLISAGRLIKRNLDGVDSVLRRRRFPLMIVPIVEVTTNAGCPCVPCPLTINQKGLF